MSSKRQYVLGFHNCIDGFYAAYRTDKFFRYIRNDPSDELVLVPLDYPIQPGQYKIFLDYAKPGNKLAIVDYALSSERFIKFGERYDQAIFCDHHPKGIRIADNLQEKAKELIDQKRLLIFVDKTRCGSKIFDDEIIKPILREKCSSLAEQPTPARDYIDTLDRGLVDTENYDQISCYMGNNVNMYDLRAAFRAFDEINARNDHSYIVAEGQEIIDKHTPKQKAIILLRNHYCLWVQGLKDFQDDWYNIVFFDILDPIKGRPLADKACKLSRRQKNGVNFIGNIRRDGKLHLSVRTWKDLPNDGIVRIRGNGFDTRNGNGKDRLHYQLSQILAPDAGLWARSLAGYLKQLHPNLDIDGDGHAGRGCVQVDPHIFEDTFFVATQDFAKHHPNGPPRGSESENLLRNGASILCSSVAECEPVRPLILQSSQLILGNVPELRYGA